MNHPPRLLALVVPPVERVEGFGVQPGPAERSVTSMSGCRVGLPLDTVTGEQVWSRNEISTSGPLSRPPPTLSWSTGRVTGAFRVSGGAHGGR